MMMSDDDTDSKRVTMIVPAPNDDDGQCDDHISGHRLVSGDTNLMDDSNDADGGDDGDDDDDDEDNDERGDDEVNDDATVLPYHSGHSSGQTEGGQSITHAQNVKIVKVVPLPHARSEVWSYFGFIADDDGEIQDKKKAICRLCATQLAYSGNTTNLFTHLKAMHPEAQPQKLAPTNRSPRTGKKAQKRKSDSLDSGPLIVRAIAYANQQQNANDHLFDDDTLNSNPTNSIKSAQNKLQNSFPADSPGHGSIVATDEITNVLVNWLVKDCRPICIVEGKGFQDLIRLLAPGYVIPDSRRLTSLVKKKYDEVRRDLILRAMQDE